MSFGITLDVGSWLGRDNVSPGIFRLPLLVRRWLRRLGASYEDHGPFRAGLYDAESRNRVVGRLITAGRMLARETVPSQDSGQHSMDDTRREEPSIEANASREEKDRTLDLGKEQSIAILRTGEEADLLRHRLERPMLLGRYILTTLGVITAAAGFALAVTTRSFLGYALGIFGTVLVVLGIVQHLLIRRERSSQPDQALLWKDGLELVLQNGEVHGLSWTDSDLALNVISRKAPAPANREYVLVCLSDPKVPLVELSAEGYELLRRTAEAQRLIVTEKHRRRGSDPTRWVEIRQNT